MRSLIAAASVAAAFVIAGPGAIDTAAAAPQAKAQTTGTSDATDFSARRRHYHHYGYRPHYRPYYGSYHRPYYYARPVYYRPYPYHSPAPFAFGIGFGPVW